MYPQVDEITLTYFKLDLDLLKFSSVLSVLGIGVSLIGVIGGIASIMLGSQFTNELRPFSSATFYGQGAILLILMVPFLVMWILLKIKTSKQDIPGIEK